MCAVKIWTLRRNTQPGGPAGKGKANIALEDILDRNGSDNRVAGSRNEGAHLTRYGLKCFTAAAMERASISHGS